MRGIGPPWVVAPVVAVVWLAMVGICLLKNRWRIAVAGFATTPFYGLGVLLLIFGSVRLARPDSWWAQHFYSDDKCDLAGERFFGEDDRVLPPPTDMLR